MSQGFQRGGFTRVWRYGEGSYRIILTAILLENQLLGVLVLGNAFDDDVAAELRVFTGRMS